MAIDMKLPRVKNFCCCCTLKCGVITIAVVFMVINLLLGIWTIAAHTLDIRQIRPFRIADLVNDTILIALCIVLLVGAIKGKYKLCMVWVYGTIVFVTLVLIISIIGSSLRAANRPTMAHRLGFLWMGKALECGLLTYGVIVVNSFAQTLRETDSSLPPYTHVEEPGPVDV